MDIILENYLPIYNNTYESNFINNNVNISELVILPDIFIRHRFSNNVSKGLYILSRTDLNNLNNYNINSIDYFTIYDNVFLSLYEYTMHNTYIYPLLLKKNTNEIIDMNLTQYEHDLFYPLFSMDTKLLFITVFTLDKNNNVIITIYGKTELINNLEHTRTQNRLIDNFKSGIMYLKMVDKYKYDIIKNLNKSCNIQKPINLNNNTLSNLLKYKLLNHQINDINAINDMENRKIFNINIPNYIEFDFNSECFLIYMSNIYKNNLTNSNNVNKDINVNGCLITSESGTGKSFPILYKCFSNTGYYTDCFNIKNVCNYVFKKGVKKGENCKKKKINTKYCKEHENNLFFDKQPIELIKTPTNFFNISNKKIKTRASLLISPSHLIEQWYNECEKLFNLENKLVILIATSYQLNNLTIKDCMFADLIIISRDLFVRIKDFEFNFENEIDINQCCKSLKIYEWNYIVIDEGQDYIMYDDKNSIKNYTHKFMFILSATPYKNNIYSFLRMIGLITNIMQVFNENEKIYIENFSQSLIINYFHKRQSNLLNIDFEILYKELYKNNIVYHNDFDFINKINIKDKIVIDNSIIKCNFTEIEKSIYNSYKNSIHKINDILLKICCDYSLLNLKILNDNSITLDNLKETLIEHYKTNLEQIQRKINTSESESVKTRLDKKLSEYKSLINYLTNTINEIDTHKGIQCPICFDDEIKQFTMFECGHNYCKECVQSLLKLTDIKCPLCKKNVEMSKVKMIDLNLKNNINLKEDSLTMLIKECNSTKLGNILNYLINNNERVLIFSQWGKLLTKLENLMDKKNISYVDLNGSVYTKTRNLLKFKQNESQVLLMNSLYFNTGLNLQYCKKIIFVEPIYGNKEYKESIKNQIIGRINRIGQEDNIEIITYIIKDTIEEELV